MTRHTIETIDNRDQTTTVLTLEDGSTVEVDPFDLYYNQYSNRVSTTDNGVVTLFGPHPKYWESIIEVLTESQHQSLDGWDPEYQVVINRYLEDLQVAAQLVYNKS